MTTLFIPGHMPLSVDFGDAPVGSAWTYTIPLKSKAERMARAVELAKADYESQERRLFIKPIPYEDFLSYHKELQGVNKCQ